MAREDDIRKIVTGGRARGLSDDQIRALVQRYDQRQQAPPQMPAGATDPSMPAASTIHQAPRREQAVREAASQAFGRPGAELMQEAAEHPVRTAVNVGMAALPLAGRAAMAAIPSKVRAGAKFQQVMGAARNVPVDISEPGNVALRIADLAQHGGGTNWGPAPVRQFIQYVTDPKKPPMTYEIARDFASNISRLSANEWGRMTPAVAREVSALRVALNKAVGEAANRAGQGQAYTSAMREYARRSRIDDVAQDVWKQTKRWAIPGTIVGYGLGKLSDLVRGE